MVGLAMGIHASPPIPVDTAVACFSTVRTLVRNSSSFARSATPKRVWVRAAFSSTASSTLLLSAARFTASASGMPVGVETATSLLKTSSGSTDLYIGLPASFHETVRLLEHGWPSQKLYQVESPTCIDLMGVFAATFGSLAIV